MEAQISLLGDHVRPRTDQADGDGLGHDYSVNSRDGLHQRNLRSCHESLLVLGPREKIPPIWRFQSCRKHLAPSQQPRDGLDGMFFSPGLVILNIIKLLILMYFRTWIVLTCNVPHEIIFRASRSNNFYYALLLMMLFLCVLPVGYTIVRIKPSWHCGPFSKYDKIFHIFTKTIKQNVPKPVNQALDYIASPGIVIPLLLLLVLIIYYLISLTGALREANEDLKVLVVLLQERDVKI
jgi:hypothetical protein